MEIENEKRFEILEGDMFERISEVKPGSVQVALIDPPYMVGSVSALEKDRIGPWGDLMNGARFFREVIDVIRPKMRVGGCVWLFGNWRGLPSLYKAASDVRWIPSGCLVWDKRVIGTGPVMRAQWELALLLTCDGFRRRSTAFADVQQCKPVATSSRVHPAQKPVDLLRRLIAFGSDPGDLVLDTFCGSGSTGVAAIVTIFLRLPFAIGIMRMNYVSIFSGIEAASAAWEPLGWEPLAFAEIEPFPCKVLAHRFPDVPNLGDVTEIDWRPYRGAVDVMVGGSPCQAFSTAGSRGGAGRPARSPHARVCPRCSRYSAALVRMGKRPRSSIAGQRASLWNPPRSVG